MIKRDVLKPLWYKHFLFTWSRLRPRSSYAQFAEDNVVQNVLGNVHRFIDVGANDGITCSNSFRFALGGAQGLLFEPTKEAFKWLSYLYSKRKECICVNEGLSDHSGGLEFRVDGLLSFATSTEDPAHTEQDARFLSPEAELQELPVKPLSFWLSKHSEFKIVDFVSLDVEGHELSVLKGIDFNDFETKCFVIETHGEGKSGFWLHRDYALIERLLSENRYVYGFMSPLNSFWFHERIARSLDFRSVVEHFQGYSLRAPQATKAN